MTQAAPGLVLQLHNVARRYGVISFVDKLPAAVVLAQAQLVHHWRWGTTPLFLR
jgi:hypothetical protein